MSDYLELKIVAAILVASGLFAGGLAYAVDRSQKAQLKWEHDVAAPVCEPYAYMTVNWVSETLDKNCYHVKCLDQQEQRVFEKYTCLEKK